MCLAVVCIPGCEVINFEINLIFLIKPSYYINKNTDKNSNMLNMKRAIKVKHEKHFSSYLKGFQLPRIVSDLSVPLKK